METSTVKTSSVTETGHEKNNSNFKRMIIDAISFGKAFVPSRAELSVPGMQGLSEKIDAAIMKVGAAKAAYKNALDARNSVFEKLNTLVTRIMNALKASATTDHLDKSAQELVRKIRGSRATSKRTEMEKKADSEAGIAYQEISSSHMSFENRAANFRQLVQFLASIPSYVPNEKDLQVEALKLYSDDLISKNTLVFTAMADINNARAERNDLMYKPVTGMIDLALDVKSYVKSVFGSTSLQYKKIAGLEFTRYKN